MKTLVLIRPNNPSALAIIPPLNIGYLASAAWEVVDDIQFIDALRDRLTPEEVCRQCMAYKADWVGVTCMTSDYAWVKRFAELSRDYPLILGGAHPSALPERTLEETGADWVVIGEGEIALQRILQGKQKKGLVHGEFVDVDRYWPDWILLNPASYPHKPQGAVTKRKPVAPIMTSRGCPYECTFCASPLLSKRKIRYRDPIDVVDEMVYLHKLGINEFNIIDDNFTARREHVESVCKRILEHGMDVTWSCENGIRADKVDADLLALMVDAGCYRVSFGIESPNDTILINIKKHERVVDLEKGIELARRAGIDTRGWFILGLPGETKETLNKTVRWARQSKLAEAQFMVLDVLPGSELWNTLDFEPNWEKQSYRTPEYIPDGLTKEDLLKAQQRAFRTFYSKPGRILKMLAKVRINQIVGLVDRVLRYHIV